MHYYHGQNWVQLHPRFRWSIQSLITSGVITMSRRAFELVGCDRWALKVSQAILLPVLKADSRREAQWSAMSLLPVVPSSEGGTEVDLRLIFLISDQKSRQPLFFKAWDILSECNLFCSLNVRLSAYVLVATFVLFLMSFLLIEQFDFAKPFFVCVLKNAFKLGRMVRRGNTACSEVLFWHQIW